jgi:hypothetical protein
MPRSQPAYLASVVAVEALELGAKDGAVVEVSVAVYAEEDFLGTSRVQVVLHHEIQELPVAVPDLIDELREGYAARDQTLAGLARLEFPQATIGVPDDDTGGDVPNPHSLLRHDGPFLARCGSFPIFPNYPSRRRLPIRRWPVESTFSRALCKASP